LGQPHVHYPTEVLDFVTANLPVLDEIDPHVGVRFIKRQVIAKAKLMHKTHGTIVPLIIGDMPGMLRRLHLMGQKGMTAFFDPEDIVKLVVLACLDAQGIGTQAVFGN
jgi:hypothetical protein